MVAKNAAEQGLRFVEISEQDFDLFARRHGTSDEVGRIGTYLEDNGDAETVGEPFLFGLYGCEKLCAAVSCTVRGNADGHGHVCKLDSVIVDADLRRRGLASALVADAFREMLAAPAIDISRVYSYAVHPATVAMLKGLLFSDPPALGAPICSREITGENKESFLAACHDMLKDATDPLRLQCALCIKDNRKARPWCNPGAR